MSLRTLLENTHSYLPKLAQQFKDGKVSRREFLRTATLLGLSSAAAYSIVGLPETGTLTKPRAPPAAPSASPCACSRSRVRTPIPGSGTP